MNIYETCCREISPLSDLAKDCPAQIRVPSAYFPRSGGSQNAFGRCRSPLAARGFHFSDIVDMLTVLAHQCQFQPRSTISIVAYRLEM